MANHPNKACEMCTRTCMLIHGQKDPSPVVSSFFKVMVDECFFNVLYFPPRFARLISHLTDEETELEDSTGQRWRVGICNHNGSLAIRQGWDTFSTDHGLKVGDVLVFHYIQGQHFDVQIYGSSGCQKINFSNGTHSGKKRHRNNSTATSHDDLSPGTDINGDTRERLVVPEDHISISLKSAENAVKGKKTRVDKRELQDKAAKTCCPTKLNGKEPKMTEKDGQVYPEAEIGNNKVIESEPADSGDTLFPDADNFSCLLQVDGRNFLELPQSWTEFVVREKNKGKIIIYLKGPDNRCWPVIYHENFGSKVLTGNWTSFTEVHGLKPGDECLFQLSNWSERTFTVQVAHKVDVTTLS